MSADRVDRVRLEINGRSRSDWTRWSLVSDLVAPADDFEFALAKHDPGFRAEAQGGDWTRAYINDELVMTGRVDSPEDALEKRRVEFTIYGRDPGGWLTECCPTPQTWEKTDLARLAKDLITPFGVEFGGVVGVTLPKLALAKVEPGESIWDCLIRYAVKDRLALWFDVTARLFIGRPQPGPATKSLYWRPGPDGEIQTNMTVSNLTKDISVRFSEVTVLGQAQGTDDFYADKAAQIVGRAQDDELIQRGIHRPLVITDSDNEDGFLAWLLGNDKIDNSGQAQALAQGEINRGKFEGWKYTASVPGFTQKGRAWRVGELVAIDDRRRGVRLQALLKRREFVFDKAARELRTELDLRLPGVWP